MKDLSVLLLLSQSGITGAQTAAEDLAGELLRRGHRVAVAADDFRPPAGCQFEPVPLHQRSLLRRALNLAAVVAMARRTRAQVLHAHSRGSAWVGDAASRALGLPLVVTLHGRQPLHLSRRLHPCLGERTLAVCPALVDHAVRDLRVPPERVRLVANGIDTARFAPPSGESPDQPAESPLRKEWGVPAEVPLLGLVGRLSGPRAAVALAWLREVLPAIAEEIPEVRVVAVGGGRHLAEVQGEVEGLGARLGEGRVRVLGHLDEMPAAYAALDVVVGAGRVALEALACGRPVVALGETGFEGVVGPETGAAAFRTNFGDCGAPVPWERDGIWIAARAAEVASATVGLLRDGAERAALGAWGREWVMREFSLPGAADLLEEVYGETLREAG